MYLAGKNIGENLAVSKEVAILAVPRRRRFFESKTNIRFTADKAGFFFGRFLFGEVDVLADFQKSLASFVIYIQQIFVSIMPRRDKNLTADARTASASTPTAAKDRICYLPPYEGGTYPNYLNRSHRPATHLRRVLSLRHCDGFSLVCPCQRRQLRLYVDGRHQEHARHPLSYLSKPIAYGRACDPCSFLVCDPGRLRVCGRAQSIFRTEV